MNVCAPTTDVRDLRVDAALLADAKKLTAKFFIRRFDTVHFSHTQNPFALKNIPGSDDDGGEEP